MTTDDCSDILGFKKKVDPSIKKDANNAAFVTLLQQLTSNGWNARMGELFEHLAVQVDDGGKTVKIGQDHEFTLRVVRFKSESEAEHLPSDEVASLVYKNGGVWTPRGDSGVRVLAQAIVNAFRS